MAFSMEPPNAASVFPNGLHLDTQRDNNVKIQRTMSDFTDATRFTISDTKIQRVMSDIAESHANPSSGISQEELLERSKLKLARKKRTARIFGKMPPLKWAFKAVRAARDTFDGGPGRLVQLAGDLNKKADIALTKIQELGDIDKNINKFLSNQMSKNQSYAILLSIETAKNKLKKNLASIKSTISKLEIEQEKLKRRLEKTTENEAFLKQRLEEIEIKLLSYREDKEFLEQELAIFEETISGYAKDKALLERQLKTEIYFNLSTSKSNNELNELINKRSKKANEIIRLQGQITDLRSEIKTILDRRSLTTKIENNILNIGVRNAKRDLEQFEQLLAAGVDINQDRLEINKQLPAAIKAEPATAKLFSRNLETELSRISSLEELFLPFKPNASVKSLEKIVEQEFKTTIEQNKNFTPAEIIQETVEKAVNRFQGSNLVEISYLAKILTISVARRELAEQRVDILAEKLIETANDGSQLDNGLPAKIIEMLPHGEY